MPGEAEPMTEAGERTARRAPSLSAQLRSISGRMPGLPTGTRATLRRLDPAAPGRGVDAVIPLLIAAGVNRRAFASDEGFRRWALICHLVATLAGTAAREVHAPVREHGADGQMTGPRHREREAGRRIHAAGVSETRLMRLTTARGPALVAQIARIGRFLAAAGAIPLDLTPLAHLILSEGLDETRADEARLALARAYYAAEAGNDRDTDEIDEDARA
ncbi:type I-E CRISPR-associated protein Cse2/CasB [Methylobacterium sp. SyP6R]|uniref:type I-E CRISPR-associated protein Cse2/CasB n=1 Tax=Methylobacterium sp. SyP6R TaxID=2718876 RepID=UPI001F18D5B5|nr:hypothetical protein [Methylobacterium sp. SyP6R]MCF4129602.1 hypothetical protein [Methylobacterium sp. SyP6R]